MGKLEHLIYTERRSGIGMSLDGKTPPSTGYGVYSMSEGLLPAGEFRDRSFLEAAINMKNGSRPLNSLLINSFAYVVPAGGMPMLGYYFQRDGRIDPMDRLAGSYVDEWYFGQLDCYPMDLFHANIWEAHQKSHTWYAYDAPKPTPYLDAVDQNTIVPSSLRAEALRFAQGREDIIRKAVWMLLKQMSLPLRERKFLVIRDTEENVRLWIATILYQLPLQAALKVGFNTNVTGLNNPQCNIYNYNKKTGSTIKMMGQVPQDGDSLERHYQAMIVGVHPKDSTFQAGNAAMANRNYVVIDGVAGTCFPVEEAELNRDYFRSMIARDGDITNFFMDMSELVDIEPNLELLDLFDAQRILQAKDGWNYNSLCQAMRTMMPHFSSNGYAVLLNYMLKYLCCAEGYGVRFAAADAENKLDLMRMLRKCAAIVNKPGAIAELDRMACGCLKKLAADPDACSKLEQYCADLDAMEPSLSARLLRDLFNSGLRFLDTVDLNTATDRYVEQIFKLLNDHIANERKTWDQLWEEPIYQSTLDRLAQRASKSDALTQKVMAMFKGNSMSVDRLLLLGARQDNGGRWLCRLISGPITLEYICSVLYRNNMDPRIIEAVLCGRMEQNGHSAEVQEAYNRYLSTRTDVGQKYYATWFKKLSSANLNVGLYITKLNELLESAAARSSDNRLLVNLLQQVDDAVTFELTDYNRKVVNLLSKWQERCRFAADKSALWYFLDLILESSSKNRNLTMYERYICKNPDCDKFEAPEKFVRTAMCQKLMETALKDAEDPAVHAVVLLMLDFDSKADRTEYMDAWAELVCNASVKSKGKNKSLAALYGLYDGYCVSGKKVSRECEQIMYKNAIQNGKQALEDAIRSIGRYLCEIRTDKVSDEIVQATKEAYGKSAADGLRQLFTKTQNTYRNTHKGIFGDLGNKLSGLFGGKGGKE